MFQKIRMEKNSEAMLSGLEKNSLIWTLGPPSYHD